jgi:hypothetical protein
LTATPPVVSLSKRKKDWPGGTGRDLYQERKAYVE